MLFRYRDLRGKIALLPDVASLLRAIESGALTPESQLSVGSNGSWQRADSVAAYREAVAGLTRTPNARHAPKPVEPSGADPSPPAHAPWHARRGVRVGLGVSAIAAVLVLGTFRLRALDSGRASDAASTVIAVSGPSREAQHALSVMMAEFGDSMGLAIRQGQDEFAAERFAARLRGAALKNSVSLRIMRLRAARVSASADSLVAQSAVLAKALRANADSLEVGDARFDGLLVRLDDGLETWSTDIDAYAELARGIAATLDSVAEFLLQRQKSFALSEGRAVFLSRADAARYFDLSDQLRLLAARRTAWAAGVFSRRSSWMAALPDSMRPHFDGPILAGR